MLRLLTFEFSYLTDKFPPYFTYEKQSDGNYTFGGLVHELLKDAENYLDIRYEFIVIDESLITKLGRPVALMKYLDDKIVDMVPYPFDQEINNLKHMEISSVLWNEHMALIQLWPKEESKLLIAIRPFQWKVWALFFGLTALFIVITSIIIKTGKLRQYNDRLTGEIIYHQVEHVLAIITSQGYYIRYKLTKPLKMMIGLWLLAMVVLIYAYTGVMTSFLTVPKWEPIVKNFQDIVTQGKFLCTDKGTSVLSVFMNTTTGFEKQIGDTFRNDPSLLVRDPKSGIQNVIQHKCAYMTITSLVKIIINQDTKANNGHCRMTTSPELVDFKPIVFQLGFPIGSEHAPAFSEYFLRANAVGVMDRLKKKYIPMMQKCLTDVPPPKTKNRALNLSDIRVAFLIFGIGLCLSVLTFLSEMVVKYFTERNFCK